jgi:hypothetical protein
MFAPVWAGVCYTVDLRLVTKEYDFMLKRSISILLAIALAGCAAGGNEAAKPAANTASPALPGGTFTQSGSPATPTPTAPAAQAAAPAAHAAAPAPAATPTAAPLPTIPAGARFSIFCESYSGPDHVKFSTDLKNLLVKNTKLKDWRLIHQSDQSLLYHGYYTDFDPATAPDKNAKREADRAQRDHQLVESIPNPQAPDTKLFPRSLFVPLDQPDPDAPPAWNLTNAPGFWTVQVAAFREGDRKRLAVEAVRQARATNVPAYYYHGDTISSVCVGSWERTAVKEQDVSRPGEIGSDKAARDNSEFFVNYTGEPLSEQDRQRKGPDGKPIRVLESKIEILDPTLMQTLKQYPEQAVDGYAVMLKGKDKSGNIVQRPRPSMIVMIPRADRPIATAGTQTNEPVPTLINPGSRNTDLGTRLKGLGQ